MKGCTRLIMMDIKQEINYQTIEYEIARLDRQIILHLAKRFKYTELAYRVNGDRDRYSAADFKTKLDQRKQWAINIGLNPNIANKLSQYLIDYYLSENHFT